MRSTEKSRSRGRPAVMTACQNLSAPLRTLGENPSASVLDHLLFAALHMSAFGTKRTFRD